MQKKKIITAKRIDVAEEGEILVVYGLENLDAGALRRALSGAGYRSRRAKLRKGEYLLVEVQEHE